MLDAWRRTEGSEAAAGIILVLWAIYLSYPVHQLQTVRSDWFGYTVPVYYFLIAFPVLAATVIALSVKSKWLRWERLWLFMPLACLPGILASPDRIWSLRQWTSWIVRGVAVGGILLWTFRASNGPRRALSWIYPVVVGAALVGLVELCLGLNPLSDHYFNRTNIVIHQPDNPLFRPLWTDFFSTSARPRGTQGNRIVYASCLVPFLAIGLARIKHSSSRRWMDFLTFGIVSGVVLLAGTRTGWVGMAVVLAVTVALLFEDRGDRRWVWAGMVAAALAALLAATSVVGWRGETVRHRLESYNVVRALGSRWLIGTGYGQYPAVFSAYYKGPLPWVATPDNQYLRWLIETGATGTIFLAAFLAGLIRAGWRRIRVMKDKRDADLYKALLAGWAGIASTFLFFDGFYWGATNMTFWCMLGLFATCLKEPEKGKAHA